MKDNRINNYFESSQNDFLKAFSKYQTQTQVVTKTFGANEPDYEIQTPGECWQWSIIAGVNATDPIPGIDLLELEVNTIPTIVKINYLLFPYNPIFPAYFYGVPYIQKSDNIKIKPIEDVTINIIFELLIPKY